MPSYGNQIAPRDLTQHVQIPFGDGDPLELDFYINRLTGESIPLDLNGQHELMSDAEVTNYRNAAEFCTMVARWNLTGPVVNASGQQLVPDDEPVPLEPEIVAQLALPFRNAVIQHLLKIAFPNPTTSPGLRRR